MKQDVSTDAKAGNGAKLPFRWILLLLLLVVTAAGVFAYWHYAEIYPSTDNAYTGADVVRVASQVSGPVIRVYVEDDDKVAAGDPLFDIDPTLYDAALRNARAQFDAAASAAGTAADALKAAATKLEEKRVALEDALAAYRKAKDAQQQGWLASGDLTAALKGWHDAWAAFDAAEADFAKAQDDKLTVTTPTVQLRAASAQLDKATHDRVQTHVTAPGAGWVTNVNLRPGTIVQAGTPAFAIIEDGRWWVDANFKETDLARIRTGQKATVRLDMYPGLKLDGVVESISAGSGATFSVLPPENATGNWVKVTQRFPVRVKITSEPNPDKPLRLGSSAYGDHRHDRAGARSEMSLEQRGRKGRKRKAPSLPPPPPIETAPPPPPPPPHHPDRPPIPLVIAVVLTAVLEVLDITIVNVAIPHMLGAFGATSDQITWVLTSYLVSAAVVMPLTGYLSTWLGRRRLLLFAICGFVLSSALCGMAWNLESMVVFRLAQGIFGAPLVPLSQAILLDAFPREKSGQALAIFGLGIMVAPVFGPVLGGYLTETYSWRMVFYINVPLGLLALLHVDRLSAAACHQGDQD